jgi:hypothetical protein
MLSLFDSRISIAGVLSLVKWSTNMNSLEVQGLAISATVAIWGLAAVAWGMAGAGSGGGVGTSIWAGGAGVQPRCVWSERANANPQTRAREEPTFPRPGAPQGFPQVPYADVEPPRGTPGI